MDMTERQRNRLKELASEAISPFLEKIKLTHGEAQYLITHGDRMKILQQAILKAVRARYKDQEVAPRLGYPANWRGFKSPEEQLEILMREFPALKPGALLERWRMIHPDSSNLPEGAEGWAVFPKGYRLAKNYFQAFSVAMARLSKHFPDVGAKFSGKYDKGSLFVLEKRTTRFLFSAAMDYQTTRHNSDFFIVAMQFGMKRADQSPLRTRETLLDRNDGHDGWVEAALGPYEVAIQLLIHPDRFESEDTLRVSCPGATAYSSPDSAETPCSPTFGIYGNFREDLKTKAGVSLGYDYLWSHGYGKCGSASAFIWEREPSPYLYA